MPVEVVLRSYGDEGESQRQVASRLSLEEPQQLFLSVSAQDISGYEKIGTDLTVEFASGDSLYVDDFFVMGENGDYSRLVTQAGDVLVTGLMAPEPELQAGADVASEMSVSDAPQAPSEAGEGIAHEGTDPLLLVGAGLAGLATSSAVDFFDDSSSQGGSPKNAAVDALAASELEERLMAIDADEDTVALGEADVETSPEINVLFGNFTDAGSDLLSDLFAENTL
ncbi:hypothetical protein CEW89_00510 [Celeribacter ethanolicus]|uniref:Biofilm-associated protein BapA-like prefix-like domain-containing protein n=1 Tax=Celeribacter ethanolicus TaxID=1758178 RepID=A0A291G7A0_9RHOB|nr:hypothetical protein [Celeribacter ethanolicus]ATG46183.1 hypothetical protein CEW89_00510 [Celeribacter ethanolicus]